ncbi:uncharacterized protein A1O5_01600, partial [Cladophialophora psammophila CBS 110553]
GWNSLLGNIRKNGCLPDDLREIAICRPAIINRAWFEWNHHAPILTASPGFTKEKFDGVKQVEPKDQGALTNKQWAVLRYSDAMTRHVTVPNLLFQDLQQVGFTDQRLSKLH